jgi:excisionase family DNA binding protein
MAEMAQSAQNRATLTTEEAAAYLGISPWFLRKDRIGLRRIPCTRIGRKYLYLQKDLDAVLEAGRIGPVEQARPSRG